jgi:hypothetical protein
MPSSLGTRPRAGRLPICPFQFRHQVGHRRFQSRRELLDDLERRHPFAAFQKGDMRAVEPGPVRQGLLPEPDFEPPTTNHLPELLL